MIFEGEILLEGKKIVAMMPVHNEADRFLEDVLSHLSRWVDEIVVLDDASTDATPEICQGFEKVDLIRNRENMFQENEARLREKLWEQTVEHDPDWILALDADELFTDRIMDEVDWYLHQQSYDAVSFRLFDLWKSQAQYRVDGQWDPWNRPASTFLVRYHSRMNGSWPERVIHCGRWPLDCREIRNTYFSDVRVKHLGWVRPEEHYSKFQFYLQKDLEQYGEVQQHTASVMYPRDRVELQSWFSRRRPLINSAGSTEESDGYSEG